MANATQIAAQGHDSARRRVGFWVLATTLITFFAASSAPTPLYLVYQGRWHFSSVTLTLVFAVYAGALLLTLLTVGGLSDFIGRRRVLAGAFVLQLVAMAAFIFADGVSWLLVARALQGVATGAATGALTAGIADLAPAGRPSLAAAVNTAAPSAGLAVGAVLSGALVQYGPAPRTLVYVGLFVLFASLLVALLAVPESVVRRPGAISSLRPRAGVPPQARGAFGAALPVLVATWAVGGLVLSLGPSLAASIFGIHNHLIGGLVVTAVAGVGAIGSVVVRSSPAGPTMIRGALVLVLGVGLFLVGLQAESTTLFFLGLIFSGWGFGTSFLGAFGSVAGLATPVQRAELFASLYAVSYLAFGGSAVLAGLAVPHFGLLRTATVYSLAVIALALVAAALGWRRAAAARTAFAAAGETAGETCTVDTVDTVDVAERLISEPV